MGMGHHVCHMVIVVVADCRQDRKRKLRHVDGQIVIVETNHVHRSPAAPENQHGVEVTGLFRDGIQGGYDAPWSLITLHHGLEKLSHELETVFVILKVMHEIAVTGSRRAGDHRQAARKCGK